MGRRFHLSLSGVEMPWKRTDEVTPSSFVSSYEDRLRAQAVEAVPVDGLIQKIDGAAFRLGWDPAETIETSMSAVSRFQRCPKAYWFEFVEGWKQREKPENMRVGSLFHAGAAAGYRHWQESHPSGADLGWLDAALAGAKQYVDEHPHRYDQEHIDLVADMLSLYYQEKASQDRFDEIISVEESFVFEFHGARIRCTFDLLARVDRRLRLRDYKTVGSVHEVKKFLPLDFQLNTYLLGAWRTYGEIPWLDYDAVRREVPPGFGHRSEKTKSGAKSTASREVGDYIRREPVVKSAQALEAFEQRLAGQLDLMAHAKSNGFYGEVPIKSGGSACDKCAFYGPCVAAIEGRLVPVTTMEMQYRRGGPEKDDEVAESAWVGVE